MIDNTLCFIQNIIDNINGFVEPLLYEVQRYAVTYPDAFRIVFGLPIILITVLVMIIVIVAYSIH